MPGSAQLAATLERIDGRGYKAYRDIEGVWEFAELRLFVDRVQSDPFAAPSKLRLRVPRSLAALPENLSDGTARRIATSNWLARRFQSVIRESAPRRQGTGKGGLIAIDAGGPEVLERTAVVLDSDWVEARIEVGLPAAGRRALGREAAALLTRILPEIATRAWIDRPAETEPELRCFVDCVDNQECVRERLNDLGLMAFVGDGALLPRESGASSRPMPRERSLPFVAPDAFSVEIEVPHADAGMAGRVWRGMGIPRGVVLLVGGGYHGKSTLLQAIENGVVAHEPGDGRETVVSDPALVKVRAEDGRSVTGVDIQGFIDRLPTRPGESEPRSTRRFSTADASGSTSQAANICEAIEAGARGLLLDEDTCATNFMIRDARMQALVHPDHEPITPFSRRVRALHDQLGVSSLIVMGGSGDYFPYADAVIELRAYRALDATARARAILEKEVPAAAVLTETTTAGPEDPIEMTARDARVPLTRGFDARRGRREIKLSSRDREEIVYGTTAIDLRGVDQLFDPSQTRAIAGALHVLATRLVDGRRTIPELLDALDELLDTEGLDVLDPFHRNERHPGALARPRRFEIAAALNRMRTLSLADSR